MIEEERERKTKTKWVSVHSILEMSSSRWHTTSRVLDFCPSLTLLLTLSTLYWSIDDDEKGEGGRGGISVEMKENDAMNEWEMMMPSPWERREIWLVKGERDACWKQKSDEERIAWESDDDWLQVTRIESTLESREVLFCLSIVWVWKWQWNEM